MAASFSSIGGGFSPPDPLDSSDNRAFRDIKLVDVNDDGKVDVVTTHTRLEAVILYLGKGAREFEGRAVLNIGVAMPLSLSASLRLRGS